MTEEERYSGDEENPEHPTWESEEDKKRRNEYVRLLLADCPEYPPDERQKELFTYLDEMRRHSSLEAIKPIPMKGFPASRVDLGYIKDRCCRAMRDGLVQAGPFDVEATLFQIVEGCVQRLKNLNSFVDEERDTVELYFTTKDDGGYYEYRFSVPIRSGEEGERK